MRGRDGDWRPEAACYGLDGVDREAFFGDTTADRMSAKILCGGCPVRLTCLAEALERGETWGVWGGCDEVDLRRTLSIDSSGVDRPRLRAPRCPACKARTEHLFVSSECSLESSEVSERVECGTCGFAWAASTSVAAVKQFWEDMPREAVVVPIRKPSRVPAARRRLPVEPQKRQRSSVALQESRGSLDRAVRALAASGLDQSQQA